MDNRLTSVTLPQFLSYFDESVHVSITLLANNPDTDGLVCFENLQMDSSCFGDRTAVCYGPSRTYKTLEDLSSGRLGDVPSRFKYPRFYWDKAESKDK